MFLARFPSWTFYSMNEMGLTSAETQAMPSSTYLKQRPAWRAHPDGQEGEHEDFCKKKFLDSEEKKSV